ncbi:tyrosinase family protein [Nitrosovibrio sp. Nv17]|uniref:tyrosinase family protein n=1 Tax=Nitrosovibrio sp. Nv17 TaxID=1855339 RepID=UPI000908FDFC|nr:tyrosinase family protein [Nitrosovibrio sp. Nv17]SFW26062.1 tyrosinase [Nitrosovibrio sp. Nv17]
MHTPSQPASPSRREFLRTTAAAATALGAASLPFGRSHAQGRARYRRLNVLDPAARRSLAGYRKAIARMLQLPASDPRNWYRLALTHTMDCPHGNWWFLVWHRGYIGWFEEICRELSGDPEFALPYWDWSANTEPGRPFRASVPDVMFEDVLTPTHPAYIAQFREFHARYRDVLAKAEYWKRTYGPDGEFDDASQYGQLLARGVRSPDDLWFDIIDDPRGAFFFDQAHARGVTRDQPWLDDKTTKAVSLQTLLAALAPLDFITFASPKTMGHSGLTGFGVLEGQPHNRVHNCVGGIFTRPDGVTTNRGGFMQANLSPVDPLFFLHHANIDRIWDVWTRKQQARGYPTLPEGADLDAWSAEPFLFFVDAQGRPVSRTTAGDYATIGGFDYDYQPGSGEEAVPAKAALAAAPGGSGPALRIEHFHARITPAPAQAAAGGTVADAGLLQAGAAPDASALFAQITVALPPLAHGHEFAVLVNAPADAAHPDPASPHYAGTLSMFGHHTVHGPVTFTIPLSGAVAALRAGNLLKTDAPLDIRIVPERRASHGALAAARDARPGIELLSIVVERHSR